MSGIFKEKGMKTYEGKLLAKGMKVALVVSRFNAFLTDKLLDGALDALKRLGAEDADIAVFKVPGSFEVPFVARKLARAKKADGIAPTRSLIPKRVCSVCGTSGIYPTRARMAPVINGASAIEILKIRKAIPK